MADLSFGRPWPNCSAPVVTLVRADGLKIVVHRELSDLTRMLMDLSEAMGYDILPGQTWGYACRAISGTNKPSNHSQACADDINAPSNPYASRDWHIRNARGTFPFGMRLVCNIPQAVVQLWLDHGYGWGGFYKTKPDPMHFEFEGTVADARAITKRLRDFLANPVEPVPPQPIPPQPPQPVPPPDPAPEEYAMDEIDLRNAHNVPVTGRHVDNLQALLAATWKALPQLHDNIPGMINGYRVPDGVAGAQTKQALIEFQQACGLPADAICGKNTWKRLIEF